MIKSRLKTLILGCIFSLGAFGGIIILVKASGLLATQGTPLSADNWNTMISNFFWGSGNGGIYYNGKVGIGTSSPNKELHIKTSAGTNAELDIQSGDQPHWGIYQDETSQELRFWNGVNRVTISNGGNLNAQGICINGDCKTSWSQVTSSSNLGIYQFTGTSDSCNSSNAGKVRYYAATKELQYCDSTTWKSTGSQPAKGTPTNPGTSCRDILNSGGSTGNGTYRIKPNSSAAFQIYCDMTTDGGGWTLVAKTCTQYNQSGDGWGTNLGDNEYRTEELTAWTCNGTRGGKLSDTKINAIWSNSGQKNLMCKRGDYPSDRVKNTNMNNGVWVWQDSGGYNATLGQDYNSYASATTSITTATNNRFGRWNNPSTSGCAIARSTNRGITTRTRGNNWGESQGYYFIR